MPCQTPAPLWGRLWGFGILHLPKEPINLIKRFSLFTQKVHPLLCISGFFYFGLFLNGSIGHKDLMTDRFGSNYTKPRALSSNFKRGIGKEGVVGVLPSLVKERFCLGTSRFAKTYLRHLVPSWTLATLWWLVVEKLTLLLFRGNAHFFSSDLVLNTSN